jgi:hypothetical protein
MRTRLLVAVGVAVAAIAIAGQLDGKRVERVIVWDGNGNETVYADCTIKSTTDKTIHFVVNGGMLMFSGLNTYTNEAFKGREIMHGGTYQVEVSTAKR